MKLAIGIDAGGTYTDAVLVDYTQGTVLATAKAFTTRHDLTVGIREALEAILASANDQIHLVSLSTTLATNAIVEGHGAPVCALLIGYDSSLYPPETLARDLGTPRYALIAGGHTMDGEESEALDLEAARLAILEHAPHVQAFAISGYFGTRNPTHELAVQELVAELTHLPSTCGHELTQQLDALRRATTVTLNARLIPLLHELVGLVQRSLDALGIEAPLMLVKGDGSLMQVEVAALRPIETILSGPAASVVGARHLCGAQSIVVADMGGTTTDIALIEDGQPVLSTQGAHVGGWRTMIEAVDIHTAGLGGDSHVRLTEGELTLGPQRAIPLCLLAEHYPEAGDALEALVRKPMADPAEIEFLLLQRRGSVDDLEHPPFGARLFDALEQGPLSMGALRKIMRYPGLYQRYLTRLEREGIVVRSGFTPTDAAHVLGRYRAWNRSASAHGANALARALGIEPEELCSRILEQTSVRIAQEVVQKLWVQDGNGSTDALPPPALTRLVSPNGNEKIHFRPVLGPMLVGIGAPAETYFPRAAELLGGRLEIPEHSGVANALGAIVGSIIMRVEALVLPQEQEQGYRIHLPNGSSHWDDLEQALAYGRSEAARIAREMAERAGAADVRIVLHERHSHAPVSDIYGGEVYVRSCIEARAIGRPRLKT